MNVLKVGILLFFKASFLFFLVSLFMSHSLVFFLPYLLCIFYGSLSHLMDRLIFGNQYFYPLLVESPIKDKIESLIVRSGSTSNSDQKLSESLNCQVTITVLTPDEVSIP